MKRRLRSIKARYPGLGFWWPVFGIIALLCFALTLGLPNVEGMAMVAVAFITLLYVIFTKGILDEMRQQRLSASREFEMRLRPYVNITEVRTVWKRRGQEVYDLTIAIYLKNFGHIPAKNIQFSLAVTSSGSQSQGSVGCSLFPGEEKRDAITFCPLGMAEISQSPASYRLSIEIDYEGINTKYNTRASVRFRDPDPRGKDRSIPLTPQQAWVGVDFLDSSWT